MARATVELELSAGEREALIVAVHVGNTIMDASPELLSAVAKLKAGASANGLGTSPGGDMSRSRTSRSSASSDTPGAGEKQRTTAKRKPTGRHDGRRTDPEEVDRIAHEMIAAIEREGPLTGVQLARCIGIHDHRSAKFQAAAEVAILGKHLAIVGEWRNGPVYGKPETDASEATGAPESDPTPPEGDGEPEPSDEPTDAEEDEALAEIDLPEADADDLTEMQAAILDELDDTEPIRSVKVAEKLGKAPSMIDYELRGLERIGMAFRIGGRAGWTRA